VALFFFIVGLFCPQGKKDQRRIQEAERVVAPLAESKANWLMLAASRK
jgi:hypothetical protein